MKKTFSIAFILSFVLFSSSCYRDKYEELYPLAGYVNVCDTSLKDTYTATVSVLVSTKCESCHSQSNPSGNVDLSTYQAVVNAAKSGALLGSVNGSPGYVPMPPNVQLQPCEIDRLQQWIQKNTPQ
jgi:hypothetical protein